MRRAKVAREESYQRRPPAMTMEEREAQLISHAVALAEKQLIEGTASAQVITHYLKLGSTKERLEKEKLIEENKLLKAKTEMIQATRQNEDLYKNAIAAMSLYSGNSSMVVDDEFE